MHRQWNPLTTRSDLPPTGYRPALDGLRGIAVAAVVAYHLDLSWAKGGFLGVDLFFVLSGYLITSLLLAEWHANGRIDLPTFWTRRARRLLPASLLMIGVVSVAIPETNGYPTTGDALASVGYFANWHFIAQARSYFAELSQASPFRHMWSLSIEEQFYLLWPLAFAWTARRRAGQARALLILVVTGTLISTLLFALLYNPTDPSRAYYGTDSRVHELLIGVGLALLMAATNPKAVAIRNQLSRLGPAGAVAVVAAFALVTDDGAFYYHGGSVLFSLAVIAILVRVETRPDHSIATILSRTVPKRAGVISYGLYLWHWPIIVFLTRFQLPLLPHILATITITTLVAALSYRYVESPIRKGVIRNTGLTPRRMAYLVPAAMATTAAIIFTVGLTTDTASWLTDDGEVSVEAAGGPSIGLVGDSVAASLVPGLAAVSGDRGYGFASKASRGCAIADGFQVDEAGAPFNYSQRCDDLLPAAFDELAAGRPDVVIWYSAREAIVRYEVEGEILMPGTQDHDAYIEAGFDDAISRLTATGSRLVIVLPLPPYGDSCSVSPDSESCRRVGRFMEARAHLGRLLEKVASNHPNVSVADASPVVCGASTNCDRSEVGDLRPDGNHFTDETASEVAPAIIDLVLATAGI